MSRREVLKAWRREVENVDVEEFRPGVEEGRREIVKTEILEGLQRMIKML